MSQITVTLPYGPGMSAVATVLRDVTDINLRLRAAGGDKMVLEVKQENPLRIVEYDLDAAATFTITISGQNITAVVSS